MSKPSPIRFSVVLNCDICGTQVGQLDTTSEFMSPETVTKETLGFDDQRCDACLLTHGGFNELIEEIAPILGGEAAHAMVKTYRTQKAVATEYFKNARALETNFKNEYFREIARNAKRRVI